MSKLTDWWAAQREASREQTRIIKETHDASVQRAKDAQAAEQARQAEVTEKLNAAKTVLQFCTLQVQVADAEVVTTGQWHYSEGDNRVSDAKLLGPLAGAEAQIADGWQDI
jgi:hypothetical protein